MSLGHREHQDVTGGGGLSVIVRRYPCVSSPGATTAPGGDWL